MTNFKPHTIKPHYILPLKHTKLHNTENTKDPPSIDKPTNKPNSKPPISPQKSTPSSPPGLSCLSILINSSEDTNSEDPISTNSTNSSPVLKKKEESSTTEPQTPTPSPQPPSKPIFEFASQETIYSGPGHNLAASTWSNQHPPSLSSRLPHPPSKSYTLISSESDELIPHAEEEIFSGLAFDPEEEEKKRWQEVYETILGLPYYTFPKRIPPFPVREDEEDEEEERVYEGLGQEQEGGTGMEVGIGGLIVPSGQKMQIREIRRRWGEWRW